MADIFFSYARADQAHILPIVNALKSQGFDVFFDGDLCLGEDWNKRLDDELAKAKCLLVAVSAESIKSEYVRGEIIYFKEHKKLVSMPIKIIPLKIEHAIMRPLTNTRAAIDLIDWNKDPNDPKWQELVLQIKVLLQAGYEWQANKVEDSATNKQSRAQCEEELVQYRQDLDALNSQLNIFNQLQTQLELLGNNIEKAEADVQSGQIIEESSLIKLAATILRLKAHYAIVKKQLERCDTDKLASMKGQYQQIEERIGRLESSILSYD